MADEQGAGDAPLISVIVPVRNGMPWLEHQLSALSAQDVPVEWEVLVADNGSDDATRSCVERWSGRNPRLHLVDASARRGAAATRNIGVASARGSLLAFCDADDVVQPEKNSDLIEQRYRQLKGEIQVIHKPGVGHHPHGLDDPKPVVDFILKHASLP